MIGFLPSTVAGRGPTGGVLPPKPTTVVLFARLESHLRRKTGILRHGCARGLRQTAEAADGFLTAARNLATGERESGQKAFADAERRKPETNACESDPGLSGPIIERMRRTL